MKESDLLLIVEDFSKRNLYWTRYSLSTKVSDSISSGLPVFAAGNIETGCINFLKAHDLCITCTSKKNIAELLKEALTNGDLKNKYHLKSIYCSESYFSLDKSCNMFDKVLHDAIKKFNNQKNNL